MTGWAPDLDSLSPEERDLAEVLPRMDRIRAEVKKTGDLVKAAEVDAWFRQHAPAIRRIRNVLEEPF